MDRDHRCSLLPDAATGQGLPRWDQQTTRLRLLGLILCRWPRCSAAALLALLTSAVMSGAAAGQVPETRAQAALPPLDLAAISRLVDQQNGQIAVARARVHEAWVEKHVADQRCLGTAKQLEAEGKIWQQQLEQSRVISETLLDATGTYVDLLAAQTGEAIGLDLQKRLQELLGRARKLAGAEKGAGVQVPPIEAQFSGQQRILVDLRQQATAASAKLAYALGLEPETKLVLLYDQLMEFQIATAPLPARELINRALTTGPGVREMEGTIQFLERAMARANDTSPVLQLLAPHLRGRVCIAQAKLQTTLLAYQDLRGKLAAGVLEARAAILAGREQVRLAEEQITHAERAYELSNQRSKELVEGSSFSEVLSSLMSLSLARGSYVNALRSYNRAQLRLWVLLGADGASSGATLSTPQAADRDCPIGHGGPQ